MRVVATGPSARRPLSMSQQAILDADRLRPGILSAKATLSIVIRVRGPLDLDRLARAYDLLVSRHEVLRSRLVAAAGQRSEVDHAEVWPHRLVSPELVAPETSDARTPDEVLFARWDALDIDPHEPPLVRCFVVPRQPSEHLVGLVFSHTVVDPTGVRVAVRQLAELYGALDSPNQLSLPPAAQYSDYAVWEAARFKTRGELDRAAWRRTLAGSKPARYERQVAFVVGRKAAPVTTTLPVFTKAEIDAIASWSWRHRSTLSITLLAAFARAIREDADRDDLLVSTVFEQRGYPAARDMLGLFLRAAPVRLHVDEDEPMPALVLRAQSAVLEAYERAQLPMLDFARLMPRFLPGAMGLEPTWFRFFQYVPTERSAYRFGAASATIVHLGGRGDPEDLVGLHLGVFHAEDGSLHGRLNYDTNELDAQSALRVLEDFRQFAGSLV